MNNDQFRRLMLANSAKKTAEANDDGQQTKQPASKVSLGSRQKASIPMTPRSVGGQTSFARQLAERQGDQQQKKFKTSTPRGSKLASGYTDRSGEREAADDDRAKRLKALDQSLKDEEIDKATYDRLREEIAGGDLESTHLVKGLDFKLLERVRRGEDVYSNKSEDQQSPLDDEPDLDDEFDKLEGSEVQAVEKEKAEKKKGQFSTVAPAAGKKRTRDQILAELKASREAAKAKAEPALGDRFKKIGGKQMPGSRIERDSKGREVLIIVDEDGHEKRKVRKIQPGAEKPEEMMPDATAKPLGMELPEQYRKQEVEEDKEDSDVDIFADVGDDYDPLAGMDDSDSDSDEDGNKESTTKDSKPDQPSTDTSMPPPPKPATKQNYFQNSKTGLLSEETSKTPSMSDPAIMAAIKRASALRPIGEDRGGDGSDEEDDESVRKEKEMKARHKKMLENTDRDADDMDMGFGTSRFEDEEDGDEEKIKLSNWGDDGDDGGGGGGKTKRKRGPKKRKGDANNADDVLRVMEQRKKDKE